MEKGGKLDRWILKVLGADPDTDIASRNRGTETYEELLRQEEEHRRALEQELYENQLRREQEAAAQDAARQHEREMLRMEAEAQAFEFSRQRDAELLEYQRRRNKELLEEMQRQNPKITSFSSDGAGFSATWDPSIGTSDLLDDEVFCQNCAKKTAAKSFCSHCGGKI